MNDQTYIRTGDPAFDELIPRIAAFLDHDIIEMTIDGRPVRGFRTPDAPSLWIRDHGDMMRGGKYFFPDLTTAVDHFAETQSQSGRIFDYVTTFPEKLPCEKENWTKYVRVPVEADVEYRFVKAAYLAWQATGDDGWIRRLLPSLERALQYIMNHPWYWDAEHGLVKRAYTIDTWDFAYTAGKHDWLQFQIDDDTFWGIMHGDNSGYYEAFRIMARLYERFGERDRAASWTSHAERLRDNLNTLCWNGRFYTHFVKLSDMTIPGVDEAAQLSLSNPININRGVADLDRARSIIQEYIDRRADTQAFAEWFSIDPPFPAGIFGDDKLVPGAYVNGGIMPLVGGELAKAALDHGYEAYGVDILRRYHAMIAQAGQTYLWYFPDGTPATIEKSTSPDAQPTDGWGSTAMLYALIEGLAGIQDRDKSFQRLRLSPRWPAAEIQHAEVRLAYAPSQAAAAYTYNADNRGIEMHVTADAEEAAFHILLPAGRLPGRVTVDGREVPATVSETGPSRYVDFAAPVPGTVAAHVRFT